uniref:Centriolar coiled-coil protein 110 n=1 Tax=Leptobrachium leishanense TaxID=445787 RepID=A0A8C5QEY3_9ANUR
MEPYDDYCKKQFARFQGEAVPCDPGSVDESKVSFLKFHGVAVLSPLLTVERREEMQQYKLKAIELDEKRQKCKKTTLLSRVQEILESVQVKKSSVNTIPGSENEMTDHTASTKAMNGFALLPNVVNLPMKSPQNGPASNGKLLGNSQLTTNPEGKSAVETFPVKEDSFPLKQAKSPVSHHLKDMPSEVLKNSSASQIDIPPPAHEAPDPYMMSLQNLLKKSREYIEKEQSRRSTKNKTAVNENNSDKENHGTRIGDSVKEKVRLANRSRSCSPLMVDKPALNKSNTLLQAASSLSPSSTALTALSEVDVPIRSRLFSGIDTESDEDLKTGIVEYESSVVKSLTGSYAKLPSPERCLSPQMHRRRPRTLSAGHIVINKPINAYELSPHKKGDPVDYVSPRSNTKMSSSEPVPVLGYNTGICSFTGCSLSKNNGSGSLGLSKPLQNCFVGSAAHGDNRGASVVGPCALACKEQHTQSHLNSSAGNVLEPNASNQEMNTSVTSLEHEVLPNSPSEVIKRSPPAPLNKSYDVETPSPILIQSQAADTSNTSFAREEVFDNFDVKRRLELDLDSTSKDTCLNPTRDAELEKRFLQEQRIRLGSLHLNKNEEFANNDPEDNLKKKMVAFEGMKKKLEEQHAQQLLLLIAEQEREQERLQREFEEERMLRFKNVSDLSANLERKVRPDKTNRSESSVLDLAVCQRDPYHSSSNHSTAGSAAASLQQNYGSTNELSYTPCKPSPSRAPKMFAQRPFSRARTRWSQVYSPAMQKKFEKVTALAKGFLTRRLMQTEKIKNLKQTVKDTAEFMWTFHNEGSLNRGAVTAQDASLRERVLAQLRAALYEIHDIFFAMDVTERVHILVLDRELRHEKLIRQMEKVKSPRDRVALSSATQKSLDRKKVLRSGETRPSNKKLLSKSKASETSRILQPNQGQNAPINKFLCRQGSMYQKNPKKEAKCSDNLRRQHSLG